MTFEEKAGTLVRYFEKLDEAEGGDWSRQLLAAQLWQILLQNNSEVSRIAFLQLIDMADDDQGTAFTELVYWVKRWASEIKVI
jgi:hypothetical protein